jgi:hypothetical protein
MSLGSAGAPMSDNDFILFTCAGLMLALFLTLVYLLTRDE